MEQFPTFRYYYLSQGGQQGVDVGDVKYGFQSGDHNGWVLLDGRNVTALPVEQQTAAASIGFVSNLPDATDKYLGSVAGIALGGLSGANSVTIQRGHLPDFTLSGTAAIAGDHTHSGSADTSGAHQHSVRLNNYGNLSGGGNKTVKELADGDGSGGRDTRGSNGSHTHALSINTGGAHSHTITTESLNGGGVQQGLSFKPLTVNVNSFLFLGS